MLIFHANWCSLFRREEQVCSCKTIRRANKTCVCIFVHCVGISWRWPLKLFSFILCMQDENDDASSNVSSFYVFDFHENNEQVERKLHSIAFFGEGPPGPRCVTLERLSTSIPWRRRRRRLGDLKWFEWRLLVRGSAICMHLMRRATGDRSSCSASFIHLPFVYLILYSRIAVFYALFGEILASIIERIIK